MAETPAKGHLRKPAANPGQQKANASRTQSGKPGQPRNTQAQAKSAVKSASKPTARIDQSVPMVYGAEALAAATVSESKLSKLKSRLILLLVALVFGLLVWVSVLEASRPEPRLLGMTVDGRIQELPLLDAPLESRQILMDWVRRNIPDLYDWNYANYRAELDKARAYTQQITLDQFRTDLQESGVLTQVINDFLILRANIVNEPVVINETTVKGRRLWVVEIPMTLVYDSGEVRDGQRRRINQDILFTAWVVRSNVLEYDSGLMLAKYAIQPRR